MTHIPRYLACFLAVAGLVVTPAFAASSEIPTTGILVMLTVKPDVQRDRIREVMPEEVRATVRLYLGGKIRQWYSRSDGRGVVFVLSCKDVDEARAVMEGLPLAKLKLVDLEFTALAPLTPLRFLLSDQAPRQ